MRKALLLLALAPLLAGCLARAALDVATAPVRVGARTVDALTTSQTEADQKRGRALREQEERLRKLSRKRSKLARDCAESRDACAELRDVERDIEQEYDRQI
jgi:hypothetical protein